MHNTLLPRRLCLTPLKCSACTLVPVNFSNPGISAYLGVWNVPMATTTLSNSLLKASPSFGLTSTCHFLPTLETFSTLQFKCMCSLS